MVNNKCKELRIYWEVSGISIMAELCSGLQITGAACNENLPEGFRFMCHPVILAICN